MRIDLGAKVRTRDGHDAGKVRRVIIDPTSQRIIGFVVSTGGLLGREVIVGEEAFVTATGDTVLLGLTKDDLNRQPDYVEDSYTLPPIGWVAPLGFGYPADAYLLPIVIVPPPATPSRAPTIKKGDAVKDRDGDTAGVVNELLFDASTGEISGFIVKAGGGLQRLVGGGKIAEIPIDAVARVAEGTIHLSVDREEIVGQEEPTGTR